MVKKQPLMVWTLELLFFRSPSPASWQTELFLNSHTFPDRAHSHTFPPSIHNTAFEKTSLSNPELPATTLEGLSHFTKSFLVQTDASDVRVGTAGPQQCNRGKSHEAWAQKTSFPPSGKEKKSQHLN